jgi:hypothetical protein
MKKFLILTVLALSISSAVFSLSESWVGLGFGWGNLFESSSAIENTAKAYMVSPGINYDTYEFRNKNNIGLFLSMAFLFPASGVAGVNGEDVKVDLSVYDSLFLYDAMIGPGFRLNLSNNFKLKFGVGFHYMMMVGAYTEYMPYYGGNIGFAIWGYTLGIGGDIGVKFDVTNGFYISIGSALSYDFANHTSIYSSFGIVSGWAGGYSAISLRPYICLGINLWAEESGFLKNKMGKPE